MVTLSRRQGQLLQLYSVGATDQDIALELRIGLETVKEHGAALREKLQARTRAHCVAIGLKEGLIHADMAVIEGRA